MSKFWFGLKLTFLLALALLIFLCIFWTPISSYSLEWYVKKKVEKELGDVLHIENVVWEDGVLLFIHPTLSSKSSDDSQKKNLTFQAGSIAISYDYSLWERKINFSLKFVDPIFTMNSKTEMILKAMLMGKSKRAKFISLQWQLSIPNGTLQNSDLSLPFSLEIANGKKSSGDFLMQFGGKPPFDGDNKMLAKSSVQGHFFSETPGEQIIDLDFDQTPLPILAKGLGLLNIHLGNLQINSGVANGNSRIKFKKKQLPQFCGELVFLDVGIVDPTVKFSSKISKAVLTFPNDPSDSLKTFPGKFELQGPSHFSLGKGFQVSSLKGGASLDSKDAIDLNFEGLCHYDNQLCLFKLGGKIASFLEPMNWKVSPQTINASIEMPTGKLLAVEYADEIAKVHFTGTPLYLAKLMPDLIKKGIQKQFGEELLSFNAQIKKRNDLFAVDATAEITDSKELGRHTMKLGFDLIKNADSNAAGIGGFIVDAGWFVGNDFPITKFVEPFLPSNTCILDGNINFQGTFDADALAVRYQAKKLIFENTFLHMIASSQEDEADFKNEMAVVGKHSIDFLQNKDWGEVLVKGGKVLNKKSQLSCTAISTSISFADKKIEAKQFEGYCCDLFLSGNLSIDLNNPLPGHFGASLAINSFNGTVSNFQRLISQLSVISPLTTLPLQGNIYLGKGPHFVDLIFSPDGVDVQTQLSGSLSEGILDIYSEEYALKELSFDFSYDLKSNSLLCDNLQGSLFLGKPEEAEEYDLTGNYIYFRNFTEQQAEFDVVVVDKDNDELLRLFGNTHREGQSKDYDNLLSVTVNKELSHINGSPPNAFELTLNREFQLDHFHLNITLLLQQMATTLRGFNKTKIWRDLGIPDDTWMALERNQGACSVDLKYDKDQSDFLFAFKGSDLSIDSFPIKKFLLTGKKQGNVWSIEQLLIDRISIAADIIKENQKWIFNFLGLRWDSSCLVGLKGEYYADQKIFLGNINLLEMDLQALKDLPQLSEFVNKCQPRGTFKATGQIQLSQSENSKWQMDALLNTGIVSPRLMDLAFEDINHVPCHFVSNEGIYFKKLLIPLKNDDKKDLGNNLAQIVLPISG
ncbi:MAG: hypothetical protein H0W50_00195, partial [Parachlamydiaceae bacterium]|nr:hypothetical protein [Parachlamydiaceae bacterium]